MDYYDVCVVGAGMLGSAAARHLALMLRDSGKQLALIGPAEPRGSWADHDGPFAAHYDQGRITRILDTDVLWAKLADESIKRYATLERESGINFYDEVGYLLLTADVDTPTSYGAQVVAAAHQLGLTRQDPALDNASAGPAESTLNKRTYAVLAEEAMKARFPLLSVFPGAVGVYQQYLAGVINPRSLVECQKKLAAKLGVTCIDEEATQVREDEDGGSAIISLRSGRVIKAGQVVVACGAFTDASLLNGVKLPYTLHGRTVLLVDVTEMLESHPSLLQTPSLIAASQGAKPFEYIYQLPPLRYPDGRYYVKIGTSEFPHAMPDAKATRRWFQSPPAEEDLEALRAELYKLYPALRGCPETGANCAFTCTENGRPIIRSISSHITVAVGCNGSAAKSSDEIGRLAACCALGCWPETDYAKADFWADGVEN